MKGRPLDPDQQAQESEAAELNAELTLSGSGVYRVANYLSVREPAGDTSGASCDARRAGVATLWRP